jgi:hypothetical protein
MTETMTVEQIRIRATTVTRWLWLVVFLLALCGLLVAVLEDAVETGLPEYVHELFNLESERSFAAWFSVILLAVGGTLSLVHGRRGNLAKYWRVLGFLLLLFSIDEAVSLHERAALGIRLEGPLTFAWVIPASVFVIVLGAWYISGFFPALPNPMRRQILWAAFIYVGGVLGIEFVEGAVASGWIFGARGEDSLAYQLTAVIQESLEMCGLVLFVSALLSGLKRRNRSIEVAVI